MSLTTSILCAFGKRVKPGRCSVHGLRGAISNDDSTSTGWCSRSSPGNHAISAVWRRRCAHPLDKKYSKRESKGTGVSLRCTRHGNYSCRHRAARNRYSSMGKLLSMALPPLLGIGFLFFGEQLCNSGIRGRRASVEVAPLGPLESMVGMLMSGVSIGLLFAAVTHLVDGESRSRLLLRSEHVTADHIDLRQR